MREIMGRRCKCAPKAKFKASTMTDRIIIERPETTRDEIGQPIDSWVNVATVWANVLFVNGRTYSSEFISAQKEVDKTVASMRIGWRLDITTQMRVRFRGDIYNIQAVLPDANHQFVDLAVHTGVNNG